MPFITGKSGNPNGRPRKGKSLTEALEKAMRKKRTDGTKNYDALADTLIKLAIEEKNITAMKYLYDRLDGKPKETVELENSSLEIKLQEILNDGK